MKTNPLNYDAEMQSAAQAAFADATGGDFWAEVQKLQDEQPTPEKLVSKRQIQEES